MMQPAPAFDLRHAFERQKAASAFLGPPPSLNMPAGPDFPHLPSRNRSPSPVFQTRIVQRAQQQPGSADLHSSSIVVQAGQTSAASSSTRSGSATAVHQQVVRQHYHSTRPLQPSAVPTGGGGHGIGNLRVTTTSPNVTTRDFRYVVPVDSGTTSKTSQSSSIISSGVSLSHLSSSHLSGGQHPHQSQTMVRLQKWQEVDRTREEIERQRQNYELLLQQAGSSYPPPNATPGSSGADAGFPRPLLPQIDEEDEGIQRLHSLSHNVRAPPTAAGAPAGDRQHVRVVNLATPLEVEQPSDQQILAAYTTPVDAYNGRAVGSGSNSQNVHSDQISFSAKSCTTFANSPTAAQQMQMVSHTGGNKNSMSTPGGLLYQNHPSYQQQLLLSSDASSASCSWKEKRPEMGILDSPSNGATRAAVRASVRKNFETGKVEALGSSSHPPQPPEVLMQEKVAELQERGARLRELVAEVAEEERVATHLIAPGKVEDARPGGPEASTASIASGSGGHHPQPLFYSSAVDAAAAVSQEDQARGRPRALSATTSNKGDSTAKSAAASASSVATKTSNLFQPKSRASRPHYATPTESAKKRIQQSHQQPASELLEQRSGLELGTQPRQYAYRNRTTKKAASGRMSSARVLSGTARLTERDEAMYEYLHSKLTTSAALHRQSSLDKRREMESRSVNDGSPSQEARIPERARREYVDSDGFPSALRDGSPSRIQSFPASSHFLDRPGDAALKHVSAQARGRRPITNDTTLEFLKRCGIEGFQDSFRAKMHLEKYDQQLKESVSVEEAKTGPIGGSASLVVKKAPSPPSDHPSYYVHMQKKDYAISERLHDLAKPQGSGHHDGAFAGAADAVGLGGGDHDIPGGKPLPGGVDPKNFLRRSQSSAAVGARGTASGGGIGETRTEESLRKTAAAADYNSHPLPAPLPVSPGGTTRGRERETASRPSGGTRAPTRSQSAANLMKPGQEEERALRSYMRKIDQLNAEYAPVLEKVASVANILEKSDIDLGAGAGAGGGGKNINLTMNKGARTSSISGRSSATSSHNRQGQATAGAGALTVTELAKRSSFARSRTSPGLERPSHQGPHQPREGLSTNKPDSKKSFRGSVTSDLIVEAGGTSADDFANMNDEAEFRNRAKPASTSSRKSREAVQRQARLIGKIMAARNNRAQSPGSGAARSASPIAIVHNMPSGSAKGVISPGDARNIMLFDEVDRRFVYEKTGAAGGANKGGVRFQELQKAHKALMEKGAQALARAPSPQMAVMVAKQRAEGILRSTSPRPARQGLSTTAKKVSNYRTKQAELRDDLLLVRGNSGDIRDFYDGVSVQAGLRAPQATGSSGVVIVADPRTVGATTAQTPVEQGEGKPKKARKAGGSPSPRPPRGVEFVAPTSATSSSVVSSEKKQKFPIRTGAPAGFTQAQGRRALQSARERRQEESASANARTRGKPKKNSQVWRQVLHEVAASSPAPRASGAVDDHAGGAAAASTTAAFDYPRPSRETQLSAPSQHDDDDKNLNEQIDSVLARAQKLTGGGGERQRAARDGEAEKSLRIDMESPAPRAAASAGGREDANVVRNIADSTKKFMFNPELPYATPDLVPSSGVNLSHDDSHLFATAPQTRKDSEEVFHTPGPAQHGSGRFGTDPGCSGPGAVAPEAAAPEPRPTTTSTASSAAKEAKLPQTNKDAVLFNVNNYYVSTANPAVPPPTFSKISSRAEMTQTETDTSDTTSDAGAATAAAGASKSKSRAQRYSLATPAQNRSKEDLSCNIDGTGRPPPAEQSASLTESPTRKWYCAPNESEEKLLLQSRRKQGPQVVGEADLFVPRLVPQPYLIHTNQNVGDSCDLPVVAGVVGEEWVGEKKIGFDKPKCGAASGGFRAVGGISARDDRDAAAKRSRSPSRSPAVAHNKSSPNREQAQPGGHQSPSRQLLFSPKAAARSP